jgi:hypothetical protein
VSIPTFQDLAKHRVALGLILILGISLANLRGIKESGRIFSVPTYIYIAVLGALVSYGLFRSFVLDDLHHINALPFKEEARPRTVNVGTLFMRGFRRGAVALHWVEAIPTACPSLPPESKNAATTLVWMGLIRQPLHGRADPAHHLGPYLRRRRLSYRSSVPRCSAPHHPHVVLQFATAAILTSPRTGYADFPVLSSIIARTATSPSLTNRGDRLVFSNGVVARHCGRCAHHRVRRQDQRPDPAVRGRCFPVHPVGPAWCGTTRRNGSGYKRNIVINAVGWSPPPSCCCVAEPFTSGAWVPLVVIPIIVFVQVDQGHYTTVAQGSWHGPTTSRRMNHTVVVLVSNVHCGVLEALAYARSLNPSQLIVSVVSDEESRSASNTSGSSSVSSSSSSSSTRRIELARPVMTFIDELDAATRTTSSRWSCPSSSSGTGEHPPQSERIAPQGPPAPARHRSPRCRTTWIDVRRTREIGLRP